MDNLFKKAVRNYKKHYDALSNDAFALDEEKNQRMQKLISYCEGVISEENGGSIEYCVTTPKNRQGEITLRFVNDFILGMNTTDLPEFCEAVKLADGINIRGTGLEDGSILMSFFVDDLYVKKST